MKPISKEQFIQEGIKLEAAIDQYFQVEYNKGYNEMIHGETEDDREKGYNWIIMVEGRRNNHRFKSAAEYGEEYDSCKRIWDDLTFNFEKTEWLNEDTFAVTCGYKRLSGFAIMLSHVYEIVPTSGFSFGSSFTEHQGKTKAKHPICITGDDTRGIIKFQLKPTKPYWLPDVYLKNQEAN